MNSPDSILEACTDALNRRFDALESARADHLEIEARLSACKRFAMTPCSHYARELVRKISASPELSRKIIGCFDTNTTVNFPSTVKTFPLSDLTAHDPDLVVVATSRFHREHVENLVQAGVAREKIFAISAVEGALKRMGRKNVLDGIMRIVGRLHDDKSRMDYLLVWLSLLSLDESVLDVFPSPDRRFVETEGAFEYGPYRLEGMDDPVCMEELYEEIYRIPEVSPRRGDVAFDLGAYRGDTVAFLEKYVGPEGKIFAFEPDDHNIKYLLRNNEINGFSNVHLVRKGCYHQNCRCVLTDNDQGGSALFVLKDGADTDKTQTIDMVTIDHFMNDQKLDRVDFIKADIEGCEVEMLQGARETFANYHPRFAIALYHSIDDLLRIPLALMDIHPHYRLFVRQRSRRPQATIIYGV